MPLTKQLIHIKAFKALSNIQDGVFFAKTFSAFHRLTIPTSSVLGDSILNMLLNNHKYLSISLISISIFLIQNNKDKYKLAQRVIILKNKTRLTVINMHSNFLSNLESVS